MAEDDFTFYDYVVGFGAVLLLLTFFWLMFAVAGLMDDSSFSIFKNLLTRGQE